MDREYGKAPLLAGAVDVVLMSYSLSMIPQWQEALRCAALELKPGGRIGVVDFCMQNPTTAALWFCRWMKLHNVMVDRPYLPLLTSAFSPSLQVTRKAFSGLWSFYRYVGRRG